MLRLAVFADIHGKFLLPFKLVDYYQQVSGKMVDWILQCGDMGAFPHKEKMDKATLRHARQDPDELGFMRDFYKENIKIRQFLQKLDINMLCVRGNHEDHEFLDEIESVSEQGSYPIDAYQRVYVCKTGMPIVLTGRQTDNKHEQCSLVGVGRIGDRKGRNHSIFIQEYERKALSKLKNNALEFDILLTHDKPSESNRGYGSIEIADLLNHIAFGYHFYGHTGEPYHHQIADNGITKSIKIAELEFNRQGKLSEGCMLIVEKHNDSWNVEAVPLYQIIHFMKGSWQLL